MVKKLLFQSWKLLSPLHTSGWQDELLELSVLEKKSPSLMETIQMVLLKTDPPF